METLKQLKALVTEWWKSNGQTVDIQFQSYYAKLEFPEFTIVLNRDQTWFLTKK